VATLKRANISVRFIEDCLSLLPLPRRNGQAALDFSFLIRQWVWVTAGGARNSQAL